MPTKYPLHPRGGGAALKHWKEFRPKMYRELQKAGQLEKAAYAAQQLTVDMTWTLQSQGWTALEAWNMAKLEWIYLPDEKTVPVLGNDPATWEPPPEEEDEEE